MSLRGKYGSERKISPCLCGESTARRGRSVHVSEGESTARRGRSVHVSEGKVRLGEEDQSMSLWGKYGSERKISHVSEGKVRLGEEDQSMSLWGKYGSERKISPCL
ncbi:hypothetical protein KUCAC02_037771 [Chaenocephalus aceratus]|nr:hypothetical protein KUCAC02_037771 [Chaenocephalus aceratus]